MSADEPIDLIKQHGVVKNFAEDQTEGKGNAHPAIRP